jgi:hypothetical protein
MAEELGFISWQRKFFAWHWGSTQLPKRVPGALSPGVEQLKREADHSPQSNVKVKNVWNYTSTAPYIFMVWCLIKYVS